MDKLGHAAGLLFKLVFLAAIWSPPVMAYEDDIDLDEEVEEAGGYGPGRTPSVQAELHHQGWLSFALPPGYERAEGESYAHLQNPAFIKPGGRSALRRALPDHEITRSLRRRWLADDKRSLLTFRSRPLSTLPSFSSKDPQKRQEEICKRIMGYWDRSAFALYDGQSGIGRCVNYDGAFVAVFTREIDNYLVMIESIDFVEYIKWREGSRVLFDTLSPQSKWWALRRAANATDSEIVLRSVRKRTVWVHTNPADYE